MTAMRIIALAIAIFFASKEQASAGDDTETKCAPEVFMREFMKAISGPQGVLDASTRQFSASSSFADQTNCLYRVKENACVEAGRQKLFTATEFAGTSVYYSDDDKEKIRDEFGGNSKEFIATTQALLRATSSLFQTFKIHYRVSAGGYFSSPKIEIKEIVFSPLSVPIDSRVAKHIPEYRKWSEIKTLAQSRGANAHVEFPAEKEVLHDLSRFLQVSSGYCRIAMMTEKEVLSGVQKDSFFQKVWGEYIKQSEKKQETGNESKTDGPVNPSVPPAALDVDANTQKDGAAQSSGIGPVREEASKEVGKREFYNQLEEENRKKLEEQVKRLLGR